MTNTITKERRDAVRVLIRKALQFSYWAAGEGIGPTEGQPAEAPDDFLVAYSDATGDGDWEALSDQVSALLDALDAAEAKMGEPVAWRWPEPNMGGFHVVVGHQPLEHLDKWQPIYAAPPAVEPVKVKPLEWKKAFWGGKQAQTFYGRYSVGRNTWSATGFEMRDPDCDDSDTLASGEYDTEQEALDAAQALHEANIRSTLVSEKEAE